LAHPADFTPHHLMIRISQRESRSAASQYDWLEPRALHAGFLPDHPAFQKYWLHSSPDSFALKLS